MNKVSYTIVDLLDKIIALEDLLQKNYTELANRNNIDIRLKNLARVFAREERRHFDLYIDIKERIQGAKDIQIDSDLYDNASKILNEFKSNIYIFKGESINELLEFILRIEEENVALIIRIRDILIRDINQKDTVIYKVLDELLLEEQMHVINIEAFLKR